MKDLNKIRKDEIEIDYKLKKIDNLIDNQDNLELYINSLENNNNIEVPSNLVFKITNSIKQQENEAKKVIKFKDNKREKEKQDENIKVEKIKITKKKYSYLDIVKIAVCTILALIIWEIGFSKNATYAMDNKTKIANKGIGIYTQIGNITNKISEFMLKPITIERSK